MHIRRTGRALTVRAVHGRPPSTGIVVLVLCILAVPLSADETTRGLGFAGNAAPNIAVTAAVSAALFIPTLVSGYRLSAGGGPDDLLLTGHKLTAVANWGLLNYTAVRMHRIEPLTPTEIAATVVMNLCFGAAVVTGSLLAVEHDRPGWVRTTHRLAPYSILFSSAGLLLLLGSG